MSRETPADLARRLTPPLNTSTALAKSIAKNHGPVARVAHSLGIDLADAVAAWIDDSGLEAVQAWVRHETDGRNLLAEFEKVKVGSWEVLSALLVEHRLGQQGSVVGPYLHSAGSSYSDALIEARWMTAEALKRHAGRVPFFEQILLTRTCDLARQYFDSLRPFAEPASSSRNSQKVEREIARLTVTSARFGSSTVEQLEEAVGYLNQAITEGEELPAAIYKLEAHVELYHSTGDPDHLKEALRFSRSVRVPPGDWPAWHVSVAEANLAIVEHATQEGAKGFVKLAYEELNSVLESDLGNVTLEIRAKLLRALAKHAIDFPNAPMHLQQVHLPFFLRTTGVLPETVKVAADYLIRCLQSAADRGQYQHREFLAEMLSRLSQDREGSDRADLLRESIRLREPIGNKGALKGSRDQLSQALDFFALHPFETGKGHRAAAISILLDLNRRDPSACEPLVLLARDIERSGADLQLRPGYDSELTTAIRDGDHKTILVRAATAAFGDQTLSVSGLGGRGDTFTVSDFSGFAGQTFVFKEGGVDSLLRDEIRAKRLETYLEKRPGRDAFGVIEHIERLELRSQGVDQLKVISVRRYARGETLRSKLHSVTSQAGREALLTRTARFLAVIQESEIGIETANGSVRRELKIKEIGFWLKKLFRKDEATSMFAEWWDMVASMPMLPRRDAHSLNWIVADDERILAVDLESKGVRPVLYELAQLIEDDPVLAPSDDSTRADIVCAYLSELKLKLTGPLEVFAACSAARSVGVLNDPKSSENARNTAFLRLLHIGDSSSGELQAWTRKVVEAWRIKVGLADPTKYKTIAPADRIRISKAMSFHLRHDPTAPVTRGGWIFADDLAEILRASGHKVTADQLLVVAGALGEPRFQLDKNEIRAAYGHSKVLRDGFDDPKPPAMLFHATSAENLQQIFAGRSGLKPQLRQFVHLTEDPKKADFAAKRHGDRVHLLAVEAPSVPDLVLGASDTWLAPDVSVAALRVPSLAELWLVQS